MSLEGESWWMIQGMPIHPGAYYWSKLLYSLTSRGLLVMLVISFVRRFHLPALYLGPCDHNGRVCPSSTVTVARHPVAELRLGCRAQQVTRFREM